MATRLAVLDFFRRGSAGRGWWGQVCGRNIDTAFFGRGGQVVRDYINTSLDTSEAERGPERSCRSQQTGELISA